MAGNKTFYISKEDFKYGELDREVQRKQIHTICMAIKEGIGKELNIEFTIERNGTLRFSLFGPLNLIEKGIAVIQRRLRKDGLQKKGDLPDGIQPLTLDNLKLHNKSLESRRQFSCSPCKETWWRWVPAHKPVSRCFKCKVRYDALVVDDEYGKGTYRCSCGNIFTGKARYSVGAKCSRCQEMVYPFEIGPLREGQRRSRHGHSCERCEHGRIYPCPAFPDPQRVALGSQPHESTGSTCSTFLTQQTASEYFEPID
ncbi:shiftless antiviral inhibitor of ribosomal frameshifting protein homolog [Anneissia japonica]|uniref:shiftless antiviral inhibitor of ribosomal frameshifting protein homolog n=1 Tax=Anneissia japonica TaxID=1529436 RepID=UPI0014258AF1|nr:shiftless antiviral inhibitor of ribosomal frameshifting protein homolog [Anneissia japonica]